MVLLVSYLLVVCAHSFAAEPTKLLIAHGAISNNVAPLWIAKEQGIFRKYGV
jgi:ABC-type nitrate/sulfonate/bicarbonate transport system substrate-binding protein